MKKTSLRGFTLTELMIVIAVISILAAVAVPKFADMVRRSHEAMVISNLGALRSAISIYYADQEGNYPTNIDSLLNKYLDKFPTVTVPPIPEYGNPGHKRVGLTWSGNWGNICDCATQDIWLYINSGSSAGTVIVNCTHRNSKGITWSSF